MLGETCSSRLPLRKPPSPSTGEGRGEGDGAPINTSAPQNHLGGAEHCELGSDFG